MKPDVVLIASCHWVTTFHPYVNAASRHRGILTSHEVPDLIHGWAYDYPGDPTLAHEVAAAGQARGVPAVAFDEPTFVLEYGTVIPLRYLTPNADAAVIPLSVCWASDLKEAEAWGAAIREAVLQSDRRAVVVASGSFSLMILRGPETWPAQDLQKLDHELVNLPITGRHAVHRGRLLGHGPSSGSGNPVIALTHSASAS